VVDEVGDEAPIAIGADVLYRGDDVFWPERAQPVIGGGTSPAFQVGWRGRFLGRLGNQSSCLTSRSDGAALV